MRLHVRVVCSVSVYLSVCFLLKGNEFPCMGSGGGENVLHIYAAFVYKYTTHTHIHGKMHEMIFCLCVNLVGRYSRWAVCKPYHL